jgi:hypothetical protein
MTPPPSRSGPARAEPDPGHHLVDDQRRQLREQGLDQVTGTPASASRTVTDHIGPGARHRFCARAENLTLPLKAGATENPATDQNREGLTFPAEHLLIRRDRIWRVFGNILLDGIQPSARQGTTSRLFHGWCYHLRRGRRYGVPPNSGLTSWQIAPPDAIVRPRRGTAT